MGFVFNLEKWTYGNIGIIKNEFQKLNDFDIAFSSLNKLSKIKSRINAQNLETIFLRKISKIFRSFDLVFTKPLVII